MLVFILFYLLVYPITVLLHELGHGLGVIISSKSHAHIYLGNTNEKNRENFRLGRLHFHIIWSFIGYCHWGKELNKQQRVIALAGGPAMSLLLTLLCLSLTFITSHGDLRSLLWSTTILNFLQFLFTIVPITYPRWTGYSGHPSDGLQLLRLLRN